MFQYLTERLYYCLGGNSDTKFYIDPDSGLISTIAPLDYETRSSYQLDVQATDGGGDNDVTSVSIDVGDVNDNPPDCSSSPRVVDIEETKTFGTNVRRLGNRNQSFNIKSSIWRGNYTEIIIFTATHLLYIEPTYREFYYYNKSTV